jgi:hypothetical protein
MAASCSLKIDINRSPILAIELPRSLEKLIITLDIEFSPTSYFRELILRIASIVQPPGPEIGVMMSSHNKIKVCGCCNIQEELDIAEKVSGLNESYLEKFKEQGLVHTIQVPVNALRAAGFLNDEQVEKITSFVLGHNLVAPIR